MMRLRTGGVLGTHLRYFARIALPAALGLLMLPSAARAQIPRITTFFPAGGRAGGTVDVDVRGANLTGADTLLIHGAGLTGTVDPGTASADNTYRPLWQARCRNCHELRSPANRSLTADQWISTVQRMVKVHLAPITPEEATHITEFLVSAAKAGHVTARIRIPQDVMPGLYEIRVVTPAGVSTAAPFEVDDLPEYFASNGAFDRARLVVLPCVVNGCFSANAERHFVKFTAQAGRRYVFNLRAFRFNPLVQTFFNPDLRLYDQTGTQLVENHGYYELDPLIDWTCPADGQYVLEIRDLLWHSNPGSVYRLTMGTIPYDTVLFPPAVEVGRASGLTVVGKDDAGLKTAYSLPPTADAGLTTVGSPFGPQTLYVSPYAVVRDGNPPANTALPAGFAGRIAKPGAVETFAVHGGGRFDVEGYGTRIGSPVSLQVNLLGPDGRGLAGFTGDGHMPIELDPNRTYTLRVGDRSGAGGDEYVYFLEVAPARPEIACVARPDNITLRPGLSAAVQVILIRREGVEGDVTVTADHLPPGVTAAPVVIPPDRNDTWLVLTAAPTAASSAQAFRAMASARGPNGRAQVVATPQELYFINNSPYTEDRADCVVAVRGRPDFTAQLESQAPVQVDLRNGVPVKVRIQRIGAFKGVVTLRMQGLPSGWVAYAAEVPGNKDEGVVLVRPDGNNPQPFVKRDPKLSPIRALVTASSDEFEFVVGSPTIVRPANLRDSEPAR